MALKKRNKINASFSMSSMTDLVFLLLIFFMITSTVVTPSAIKLLLPQSSSQAAAKPITRIYIDENINFYVAEGKQQERQVTFEEIEPFLQSVVAAEPEMYVALYAD
ncbi:MAG TPA: biopolymer transporter ExbD, partial [Candidatus Enterocola sp.]|nr:biopolymer transporter ExbD [Candidatus Enterocola sp.]